MHGTDKAKAKTLATASTLQKVVCPAPERDPQEILSHGWRKVGEQKKVTNRLANGNPDRGVGFSARDSFAEAHDHPNRQTGRQVLDKMFGHMRPHHIITPSAVLHNEEEELENGLGCQAARLAFFRPAIAPALNSLPPSSQSPADTPAGGSAGGDAGVVAGIASPVTPSSPLRRTDTIQGQAATAVQAQESGSGGLDISSAELTAGDEPEVISRSVSSSKLGTNESSSPQGSLRRYGTAAVATQLIRHELSLRRMASGNASPSRAAGSAGASTPTAFAHCRTLSPHPERRGALPAVIRSYPSDSGAMAAAHCSMPGPELARLPAAAGAVSSPAAATGRGGISAGAAMSSGISAGAALPGRRRASISGDSSLPAIGNPYRAPVARARRASLTGGDIPGPAAAIFRLPRRISLTGLDGSGGGGRGGSMPQLVRVSNSGMPHAGSGCHGSSPMGMAGRGGGGGGGGGCSGIRLDPHNSHSSLSPEALPATRGIPLTGSDGSSHVHVHGNLGGSFRTGAVDGPAADAIAQLGLNVHTTDHHSGITGAGAGGGMGSPNTPNAGMPLSGLENLAGTGLGDAISQLRNIRMGVGSGGAKEFRERKVEPGLAGLVPVQLLPVPLPPLDNWQVITKQGPELDPCKGIRLVDTANYVLPRHSAEVGLQVRMAQHQAAMRELVKVEGAPMSEIEMEAAKLLGRLERSGARHRNFSTMESMGSSGQRAAEADLG
ncbi:hypothetical protein VaNZ11_002806 [Volvox africanus]|uniref:Uncharacterized protein n=1 Tax=Volvox africanus TaxID=51714 RepID=A0ABQ5RTT2_9CHLO|nr:hypothetical protein VaNZ11_002806 [Volvox africanus]